MPKDFASLDAFVSWRKLLHHIREYRALLARSNDWSYGREDEINKHARALGLQVPFERYEEHGPDSAQGFWLRVWDAFASEHTSFPINTFDGREVRCDPREMSYVLKLLETWESKAIAELEAVRPSLVRANEPGAPESFQGVFVRLLWRTRWGKVLLVLILLGLAALFVLERFRELTPTGFEPVLRP